MAAQLRDCLAAASAVLLLAGCAGPQSPRRFCARAGTDDTLRPVPETLAPAVNAVFRTSMPPALVHRMTVYRCDAGTVMLCGYGANLPCGKADTSRHNRGAAAWCAERPDAGFVPAFAAGHDTIFAWRCRGTEPEIERQVLTVDRRGFAAQYWRPLPTQQ